MAYRNPGSKISHSDLMTPAKQSHGFLPLFLENARFFSIHVCYEDEKSSAKILQIQGVLAASVGFDSCPGNRRSPLLLLESIKLHVCTREDPMNCQGLLLFSFR